MQDSILKSSAKFRCALLDRLITEIGEYIRYGFNPDILSTGDKNKQIQTIFLIWDSLSETEKPAWISYDTILLYSKLIGAS